MTDSYHVAAQWLAIAASFHGMAIAFMSSQTFIFIHSPSSLARNHLELQSVL